MDKKFSKSTLCVQGGWQPKKGEPRVLPIYQSTTFKYDTSEQMARLFAGIIFESCTLIDGEYTGLALFRSPSGLYAQRLRLELLCHNVICFKSFLSIIA